MKASLKSAIRRSIDAISLKTPKKSPMGSSMAGSHKSDLGFMGSVSPAASGKDSLMNSPVRPDSNIK